MSSITTDVSPNINKRISKSLGDSMIGDDGNRIHCGVDESKKPNRTNLIRNKSEILPKNDTPSSEVHQSIPSICEPLGSKKIKLSSFVFDDLVKKLDYGELYMNLTKLLLFLESDNYNSIFFLENDYEVLFEMIVQDINILKSKSLKNDDYRHICHKIIRAAVGNRLFCVFEDKPEFNKKVMVIKKLPVKDQSGNSTASSSCSSGSSMLPSQTSTNLKSRSVFPPAISTGFKIHCLRTLLDFTTKDAILRKEFPELSTDQAKFLDLPLGKVKKDNFDRNKEVTNLYRELVHAVKTNEFKYEFRIKCNESSDGKKSVVFEKVPVPIQSETAAHSDQTTDKSKQNVAFKIPAFVWSESILDEDKTAVKSKETMNVASKIPVHISSKNGSNAGRTAFKSKETMNRKANIQITENPNTDAPKPDASNSEFSKPDAAKSQAPKKDVLKPDTTKSNGPKIDVLKPDTTKSNGSKKDVLKPDTTKSNGTKIDMPKTGAPVSHGPKIDVPKQGASKSQNSKMDLPQTDVPESHDPKIDVLKPDASKAQPLKISDSWASITEPPQPESWFKITKPPSRTRQKTIKKKNKIIENTPKEFIADTLNKILEFLYNCDMETLVLVPKTNAELIFYRRCIIWCSSGEDLSQFGEEFREIHCRISHLLCRFNVQVTRRCQNAYNPITRLKEVSYVKTPKNFVSGAEAKETSDGSESQSTPRTPKVNVQKALQLAATDNIKLDKVLNLNQSLRSKKKDKKQKKAEKKEAKKSKNASSSSSSRDSSIDRVKSNMGAAFVPPGPKVSKRTSCEISQSPRKTSRWSSGDSFRHEKLREAMSVPVQSDKALRMMLGMGWNGGALGPRGDGITEPIMPAFEIARGAGFGLLSHITQTQNSNPDTVPVLKKPKVPNPQTPFEPGSDVVVEKTKQLLFEDVSFDTVIEATDPAKLKINVEPPKPTTAKVELPTQAGSSIGKQKPEIVLKLGPSFRMEILQGIWDLINSNAFRKKLKYDGIIRKNRIKFVTFALQTLGGKKDPDLVIKKMFQHQEVLLCQKIRNKYIAAQIIVQAQYFWDCMGIELVKVPKKFNLPTDLQELPEKFDPQTPLENKEDAAKITDCNQAINAVLENTATMTDCNQIINAVLENTATMTNCNEIINDENLKSYIISMNGMTHQSITTQKNMQFKVLFLMHMLIFVKSFNEEYEVTFNKELNRKEKSYMENVVEQINMRIKFGSSPAETKLGDLIRQHVKDAFLGIMYDHQHTTVTLSKYFRFKRLNRPDNAVRRKAQASVNLDDFTSETFNYSKLNTDNTEINYRNVKEKFDFSEHTDDISEALPNSNECSVEENKNNNANTTVPKLLPGEESVNIHKFLCLYDKENTNTAGIRNNSIINNDSASNVTENRNSKNNIGNGNVVIDNNDNQFIDMKRAGGNAQNTQKVNNFDSEKTEYVVCIDDREEKELKSAENSIHIDSKEIDLPGKVKEDEIIAYIIDSCKDIGEDILQTNDEVTSNTENLDPNVIVIEDSDSDNDCFENKATKKLPRENCKGETDVIIKDIDADKTMKIINIIEDSMEGINTEPVHEIVKDSNAIINKDKSKVAINPGHPIPVIIAGETIAVIDKDESQAVIDIDQSKAIIDPGDPTSVSITGESMTVIDKDDSQAVIALDKSKAAIIQDKSKEILDKSEPRAVINQGESNAVISTNDLITIINLDDTADVINKDVSEVQIIQGESKAMFNTVESSKDKEVAQIKEGTSINPSDENIVKDDLVIKSDCDRIKKDNIVLSEEFCNTQKSSREQTAGTGTDSLYDKDSVIKTVRIGHTDHPFKKLSNEKIEKIQWHISNCIMLATELPLLKCHGIQNGALFYTCHNKKTYDWLQNTIGVASYAKVFDTKEVTKMALKLCGYFDFDSNYLFKMLEMYNKKISTKEWVVEKTEKNGDEIIFIVKMDTVSIKFIQESDLALFAGIDKVHFSLICE